MYKKILALVLLLLTSCVTVAENSTPTEAPILFVTSTLPPTKQGLVLPTPIPPTGTATLDPSEPTPAPTCKDSALFGEDVTIPDNTNLKPGEKFRKTWKLNNSGTCDWKGYTIRFASGEKMSAPDSVPVPETAAGTTVQISIDLVAPSKDGQYIGNFELRNATGEVLAMGIEKTFWVKIVVGNPVTQIGNTNCYYTINPDYVQQLIDLINKARADVGRGALAINDQLTNAAQGHSLDMACNNFLEHSGSDGTWIGDRLLKVGYPSSYYLEIIAIGLPQDAMNQWKADPDHWDAVINSRVNEIGVGYAFVRTSSFGGYWTVDMGQR